MIEFKNLHKSFGKLVVLNDLDLNIKEGGIFAVLGPNGSGKTTLIKCLLGMVIPHKGEITFKNKSVLGKWDYRNDLNYLPQIANFPPNLTVVELIEMVKDDSELPLLFKEVINNLNQYNSKDLTTKRVKYAKNRTYQNHECSRVRSSRSMCTSPRSSRPCPT